MDMYAAGKAGMYAAGKAGMYDAGKAGVLILVDLMRVAGGAEKIALMVATHLDPDRFKAVACASRWRDESNAGPDAVGAVRELEARRVEFLPLGRRRAFGLSGWRAWWKLYRRLRRGDIDVLHSHKFGSNAWGALIGRLARVPVRIAHEHSWSYEGQYHRRFLDRLLVGPNVDVLIAVSREDQRRMVEVERIKPEKIVYIPNGVVQSEPSPDRDLRGELGISPQAPLAGTVANLRPEKALDSLIEAAALLSTEFPDLRVLIVGDGPERSRLEAIAAEAVDPGVVRFLGQRKDVTDLLATLDVAAVSSDREGMPLSVMEYMQSALPIVSTRVGGIPHMIEDEKQGLLVEPHNPQALAQAIGELLRDREKAVRLGAAARERWKDEFNFDVTIERVQALYERLLEQKKKRGR